MVKGTAKQAVIINPGEKSGFEQAIFIISDEKQGLRISSSEELLRLADSIAAEHTVTSLSAAAGWKRRIPIAAAAMPVLFNALIVGPVVYFAYSKGPGGAFSLPLLLKDVGSVALGEAVICFVLGLALVNLLVKAGRRITF